MCWPLHHSPVWSPRQESNPLRRFTRPPLSHLSFGGVVRREGVEPSASRLSDVCSTTELPPVEKEHGGPGEPRSHTTSGKSRVLCLLELPTHWLRGWGSNPHMTRLNRAALLPLSYLGTSKNVVGPPRFELGLQRLRGVYAPLHHGPMRPYLRIHLRTAFPLTPNFLPTASTEFSCRRSLRSFLLGHSTFLDRFCWQSREQQRRLSR